MELDLPLAGSIAWVYQDASQAQLKYNEACTSIARKQQNIRRQLLTLAPPELHSVLEGAIHHLFAFKSASIELEAEAYGGKIATATLLTELARAWREVVGITIILEQDEGMKFTVHLHSVPHQ